MAKIKVIKNNLNSNLNGESFTDIPSNTIFSFGSFTITSNFENKSNYNYNNILSSFSDTVTLKDLGIDYELSELLYNNSQNIVLNLNNSDLNTFIRFGSAYEFLRVSVENIILSYPASLFVNKNNLGNENLIPTFSGLTFDWATNVCTYYIPIESIQNKFELIFTSNNNTAPDNNELKNLNLSYFNYVISTEENYDVTYPIIGFTGYSNNNINTLFSNFIKLKILGNPFKNATGITNPNFGFLNFHIKPNNFQFEKFRTKLKPFEKYIMSNRDGDNGFNVVIKSPMLYDSDIIYSNYNLVWYTTDGYNIDIDSIRYKQFLESLLNIGLRYDTIKTDLIARFLTPMSLKAYDLTEHGKITKLLRIYGREFDQIRQFIDSLVYINKITYDKINNIPDQLIKNLAKTLGWEYFNLISEKDLVNSILTIDDSERNLFDDLLPAEIDIELWRRILINTNYLWKSKGTREAIKSIFLLIGIPEQFINITEYVYTVEGKINPNTVELTEMDFPSHSLPFDADGYPIAPLETNSFYFQISGDTDSGQAYLDVFRLAGFTLNPVVDNKKSWVQTGATIRQHYSTPQYYQEDSRLIINTKEIDISLDIANGIENDVYDYIINTDYPSNNSGYTLPYTYVNISLNYDNIQNEFTLPLIYEDSEGDLEVRYNGILLNAPKTGNTTGITHNADYIINNNKIVLLNSNYAINNNNRRDVIQATFIYRDKTKPISGISVQYIVTRVNANYSGTEILLPSYPNGDVQVTINGIALTKGTSQYTADYIVDVTNSGSSKIIIQNQDIITYLGENPEIQLSYVNVIGNNEINLKNEIYRIDSFSSNKLYFSLSANKYVFKLNYKVNDASNIKVLVDGIALEPYKDYNINMLNPYEILLPNGLRYGSVISVYYLVGLDVLFNPIISDSFGLGDISNMSFLEFLELIQRKLINAKNRKTISDFKGGWYPSVLKIYNLYLKRSLLSSNNPLKSNGYAFQNLYQFLNKYNAFFDRFITQLLSATIILRKKGILIRNSNFNKQKFTYKRGVNVNVEHVNYCEDGQIINGNFNKFLCRTQLQYLGDDGSVFMIPQKYDIAEPITLSVTSKLGTAGIGKLINIGGYDISNYEMVTNYGVQFRKYNQNDDWHSDIYQSNLTSDSFTITLDELELNTTYEYRAVIWGNNLSATGDTLMLTTLDAPIIIKPSVKTKQHESTTINSIINIGGYDIQRYGDVQYYGMQYCAFDTANKFSVNPLEINNIPATGGTYSIIIKGDVNNTFSVNSSDTWIEYQVPPQYPIPSGVMHKISIKNNSNTSDRNGLITYTPSIGNPINVTTHQLGALQQQIVNLVYFNDPRFYNLIDNVYTGGCLSPMPINNDCYQIGVCWDLISRKDSLRTLATASACVVCNNNTIFECEVTQIKNFVCNGSIPNMIIRPNDDIKFYVCAKSPVEQHSYTHAIITIRSLSNICGSYVLGVNSIIASTGS